MFRSDEPVPASYVPWRQEDAVQASRDMQVTYSDRSHALRAQDLNHACLSGVTPPGLPSWPPKNLIAYPESARMIDNQAGDNDNTAAEQIALRHIATAGQVQPARTTFARTATGALTVSSVPKIPEDTPPAQASEARLRISEWAAEADVAAGAVVAAAPPAPAAAEIIVSDTSPIDGEIAIGAATVRVDRSSGPAAVPAGAAGLLYAAVAVGAGAVLASTIRCWR
jgi:hypothetical protein